MKIRSLLLAASAVALSATAANAYVITAGTSGAEGVVLSSQLDLVNTPISGDVDFSIFRAGGSAAFPPGAAVVTITLPAGRVFDGDNTGVSLSTDNATVGTRSAGGADMETSITFDITFGAADTEIIVPTLSILATGDVGMEDVTVSVTQGSAEVDTAVDVFDNGAVFAGSSSNIDDLVIVADMTASTIALPALNTLADAVLGTIDIDTNASGNLDFVPTPFVEATNVASVAFTVNFPAGTDGLTAVTVEQNGGAGSVTGTITATGVDFAISAASNPWILDGAADTIEAVGGVMGETIAAQTPTIDDVTVNLVGAGLSPTATAAPAAMGGNTELETLLRAGSPSGLIQWVGESGTQSVLRATGLPASTSIDYTVTFDNSTTGQDGTFSGTAMSNAGGEVVLGSANAFGTTNAGYKRADISINFETSPAAGATLDVDRQVIRNNNVSDSSGNED